MLAHQRRLKIAELVRERGAVTVLDLCEALSVSDMTVRRDLRELAKDGLVARVHGGAVSNLGRSYEPAYQVRTASQSSLKAAIGRTAANLIVDGDSVALDVGTTTLEVAHCLRNRQNLTVITPSLRIANEVVANMSLLSAVRLILTGGIVRSGELSMVGNIAEETCQKLHVDKALIGIGGLHVDAGLTEYNLEDALVKRELIRNANKVIVVADGTKFGRIVFASVAPLHDVDCVVTDKTAPEGILAALRQMGIEVLVAEES